MKRKPTESHDVVSFPTAQLVPYERNPRTHPKAQIDLLAASIRDYGFTVPVLIDDGGRVIAGHGRLLAAKQLGMESVPCIVARGWTKKQKQAYTLLDNQIAARSGWDQDLLRAELVELGAGGIDLALLGFESKALDALLGKQGAPTGTDPGPQDPPATPVTRTGDVWILDRHRLGCGDGRDEDAVKELLGGESFDVMVSDPPYCSGGFQEAGKAAGTWGKIASDNLSTRGWVALMNGVTTAARPQVAYIFTDWRMWTNLWEIVESAGLAVRSMIVWDKGTPGLGALWRTQHELVMFASRSGGKRQKGLAAIGNVITAQRTGNVNHYTEKPVSLLEAIIRNDASSGRVGGVYDPFLGSGTTLIACEQLGRRCFGLEVEPRYVDVALVRWQTMTGKQATHAETGATFTDVAASRGAAEPQPKRPRKSMAPKGATRGRVHGTTSRGDRRKAAASSET